MQFTLTSAEGLPIRGNLDVPAEARALVIVVHGFKGFKEWGFFPWLASELVEQRFAVCRFNTSRSGIGENPDTFDRLDLFADDTYSVQLADLRVVVDHAQDKLKIPTFLLGHSRGGGVAVLGARSVPHLHGVITWNAIARADRWSPDEKIRWRADGHLDVENARTKQMMRLSTRVLDDLENHDIVGAAAQLEVPLLAICGGRDETVSPDESKLLTATAKDAGFVKIRTGTHTFNASHPMRRPPMQLDLAKAITARFIVGYE